MLYLIDLNFFDIKILLLIIICILLIIGFIFYRQYIVKTKKKYVHSINNWGKENVIIHIVFIMSVVFAIICLSITSLEKIACISSYNNADYEVVSGEVEDFKYIYANNSNEIIGIDFYILDKHFVISKGIFNTGYSVHDNIITKNSEIFKIYYLPFDNDEIDTILRIDRAD